MSAPDTAIQNAFNLHLGTLPALPSVAWPNMPFTPAAGVTYLNPVLMTGEPKQSEIGTFGANRHTGVYQISIYAPSGNGMVAINTLRDSIVNHFKRGTKLVNSGITITIWKAYASAPMTETDRLHIPITIMYTTHAAN